MTPEEIIAGVRKHYDGFGLEKPWPDFEKDMDAVIHVVTAAGYEIRKADPSMVYAPREPTDAMFETVGNMRGFDGSFGKSDFDCHADWYRAMISAAEEGTGK